MRIFPFHSTRGCLSYLVTDAEGRAAALVDPSAEIPLETYLTEVEKHASMLAYLIETHTHADHVSSAPELAARTGAKIVRHALAPATHKDIAVVGGETLLLGAETLRILSASGHTDESIALLADGAVFTGDALLIGGTGRTDFQRGNSGALYHTLHETLGELADETIVYPAHDYRGRVASTIGAERRTNPRFALDRDAFIATMDAHHPPEPELFEKSIAANSK